MKLCSVIELGCDCRLMVRVIYNLTVNGSMSLRGTG